MSKRISRSTVHRRMKRMKEDYAGCCETHLLALRGSIGSSSSSEDDESSILHMDPPPDLHDRSTEPLGDIGEEVREDHGDGDGGGGDDDPDDDGDDDSIHNTDDENEDGANNEICVPDSDPSDDGGDEDPEEDNDDDDGGDEDPEDDDDDPDDPNDPDNPGGEGDEENDSEADEENFNFLHEELNAVLRMNEDTTARELLALVLAISCRHSSPYVEVINMMKALNVVFGGRYLPVDKKTLWQQIGRSEVGITKYVYCPDCLTAYGRLQQLPNQVICPCGKVIVKKHASYYISLDVRRQIQDLLKKPKVRAALAHRQARQVRVPNSMEDIPDGAEYRRLQQANNILSSANNFSYNINLDGFQISKSSTSEAWPQFIRWNELPWKMRQKYILLAGVWVDFKKPDMGVFLEQFVVQGNSLSGEGILWTPDGEAAEVRSRFVCTCCVVDAQARAIILNQLTPSGHFACPFCLHAGLHCGGAVHYPILPPIPIPERRTTAGIRNCMIAAGNGHFPPGQDHVQGFKGASWLLNLAHFDLGKGIVTDDLHPFSGVIEAHTKLLFTRTREYIPPYYVGGRVTLARINSRLSSIKTPTCISRKPRILKTKAKWNGSEWRNWLLIYLVPCLEGILPQQYLRHFQLLAQAVFLVTRDSITLEDCDVAEQLFHDYVVQYERYFGREKMTYNIHILLHVVECVRNWGPMYAHSTTFFESWNHELIKTVLSPKAAADQIITRFLIKRFLDNIEEDDLVSERIKQEVRRIIDDPLLRVPVQVGGVRLLGKCTVRAPTDREQQLLRDQNFAIQNLTEYKRAQVDGVEYRSLTYRYAGEETKSDNSYVYTMDDEFAQITSIVLIDNEDDESVFVFLKILNTNAQVNRYICKVHPELEEVVIVRDFNYIRIPAVSCTTPNGTYIMPIPNTRELD